MGKYKVEIDYYQLMFSGCSLKFANTIGRKRNYIVNGHYTRAFIPLFMSFKINYRSLEGESFQNIILFNTYQLLSVNKDVDSQSFISLN